MTDTRALSPDEREVLAKLLAAGSFPGAEALAKQVPFTSVLCGSGHDFLDLEVADSATAAPVADGEVPVRGLISAAASPEPVGEIIVWVERGRLAGLEHASLMGQPIGAFPAPERVQAHPRHAG